MPYVFKEVLDEGDVEADVFEASAVEELQSRIEDLEGEAARTLEEATALKVERDDLRGQLDDAKRKFADAFLSSPERAKGVQADDISKDSQPMTFEQLFRGRNDYNAN